MVIEGLERSERDDRALWFVVYAVTLGGVYSNDLSIIVEQYASQGVICASHKLLNVAVGSRYAVLGGGRAQTTFVEV
jgi:hypothetical protein